jgi:predicted small lipoprotein YifL
MRIAALLAAAALGLGVAACKSKGPLPPSESCPGFEEAGSTSRLVKAKVQFLGDPDVGIVELRCMVTEGVLRIDIDLENEKARNQPIEYRFVWYEANGMSVSPEEAWKPLILYPDERRTIRTAAPGVRAQDFKLLIKE